MTPYLADPDVTLYHGDALETLRQLPDGSVDCVVTSPPYWGLRDYGTGTWDGGDPDCDHTSSVQPQARGELPPSLEGRDEHFQGGPLFTVKERGQFRSTCGKCGARRVDRQLGLEATPDEYVANMVDVFREVRRVLADHGTCFVNLGDSYNSIRHDVSPGRDDQLDRKWAKPYVKGTGRNLVSHLKQKDLIGIPWRVAFALQADGWWLRSDIVWAKPNPMPESVTDRPTKSHEYVFMLTKQPRYWFDQEAVRERYGDPDREWWNETTTTPGNPDRKDGGGIQSRPARGPDGRRKTGVLAGDGSIQHRDGERWPNLAGRNVRSVWTIATQPYPEAHFATFPEELVRRCLLAGCPEGGIVLDPFAGSGTTLHVARKHARHAIGIELNADYCDLTVKRLQQLSLLAEGTA